MNGIADLRSGTPVNLTVTGDIANTGNVGYMRPDVMGDWHIDNPTPAKWFNTAAFKAPAAFTFGNAGRNSVRGPGFASFDLGVSRRFNAGGARAITVGLQVFNLFNRTNFDLPEHFADEPTTFGRVFSAKAPRQVQLTARVAF